MLVKTMWKSKSSPISIARIFGHKQTKTMIEQYMSRRQQNCNVEQRSALCDYMYHLVMARGTSDYSFINLFTQGLQAHIPLGAVENLANPKLNLPFSIIMGENDWMRYCDDDYGQVCIDQMRVQGKTDCQYLFCSNSGHNLHVDNPEEFANLIISDFLEQVVDPNLYA